MKKAMVILIALCCAVPVLAGPTVKYVNVNPSAVVTIHGMHNGGVYAGIYNLVVDGVATPSFCIDLADGSTTAELQYSLVALEDAPDPTAGPMGATKAADLTKLLSASWTSGLDAAHAAGLQLAVWEIVAETGSYDITSGSFYADAGGARDAAVEYLQGFGSYSGALKSYGGLTHNSAQDYVIAIPAPGALLLGSLGMGIVGWLRRRRMV